MNTYDLANSFYSLDKRVEFISLCGKEKTSILKRIKITKELLNAIKPDVVLTFHFNDTFIMSLSLIGKKTKIKHIACERNDPSRVPYTLVKRIVRNIGFCLADAWCFQTKGAANYFLKRNKNKKYRIIKNPVNLKNESVKHSLQLEKRIFTVGRLEKQKNHILLLESFAKITNVIPDYVLVIYGVGSLLDKLKEKTRYLSIEDKVFFMGESKKWHIDEFNSSLFVLSSDYEGMPNALEEALFLGIPCLSTDCSPGGAKELIENGVNGTIIRANNVEEMSKSILNIIFNIDSFRKMAACNFNLRKNYSISKISNEWKELILEVFNGR